MSLIWKFQLPWHLSCTPHLFPLPNDSRLHSKFFLKSRAPNFGLQKIGKKNNMVNNSNASNYGRHPSLTECMTNIDLSDFEWIFTGSTSFVYSTCQPQAPSWLPMTGGKGGISTCSCSDWHGWCHGASWCLPKWKYQYVCVCVCVRILIT